MSDKGFALIVAGTVCIGLGLFIGFPWNAPFCFVGGFLLMLGARA